MASVPEAMSGLHGLFNLNTDPNIVTYENVTTVD